MRKHVLAVSFALMFVMVGTYQAHAQYYYQVEVTADPGTLGPPNHKMVPINLEVERYNPLAQAWESGQIVQILSVTSDEPVNDTGDGDTEPDWEIGTDEDGNPTLALRAERAGNGDGRVYTILVSIESWAGYSLWNGSYYAWIIELFPNNYHWYPCPALQVEITVTVAHDKGK